MIPVQEFHCRMYTDFERTEVPIDPNATEEDKRKEAEQICQWIRELSDDEKRENALLQIRLIKFLMNLENIYLLPKVLLPTASPNSVRRKNYPNYVGKCVSLGNCFEMVSKI